jgi:tetratricopeptide (TPR) repeat protein
MIRRDYIIRMIEEAARLLRRLSEMRHEQKWERAGSTLDEAFEKLIGTTLGGTLHLTETELMGRIIEGEATMAVRDKTLLLAALLTEAGDLRTAENRMDEARRHYVQALNLLLRITLTEAEFVWPDFVPKIDILLSALGQHRLPIATLAALMQHYERLGEYGRAEDTLYSMMEIERANPALLELGAAFYRRLLRRSDETLVAGGLPRPEVMDGLAELGSRQHLH